MWTANAVQGLQIVRSQGALPMADKKFVSHFQFHGMNKLSISSIGTAPFQNWLTEVSNIQHKNRKT